MDEAIHEETRHGLKIEIHQDTDPMSPGDWGDGNLFLIGNHRQFTVINKITQSGNTSELKEKYHVFELEAYIHSGVVLALKNEGDFCDRQWDVSEVGVVFVSKIEFPSYKFAKDAALALIEAWNNYLSGEVYGFIIKDAADNELESCWGFSGDYEKYALVEARAIVDRLTKKGLTDHTGQVLFPFMKGK